MPRSPGIQRVVEAERRNRLWSRRVFGFPVWSTMRLSQWKHEEFGAKGISSSDSLGKRADKILRPLLPAAKDLVQRLHLRDSRDIWVLGSTTYRRRDATGAYQCIFAEHLREQLGDRLLYLERNAAYLPSQQRDDVVYVDSLLSALTVTGRALAPVLAKLAGSETLEPFAPIPRSRVCREAFYGAALASIARKWLAHTRPQAVFVLCAYAHFIPFQIAARELGIPVIELQHGIIYDSHPGYVYDDVGLAELPHLPDHIVVFGEHFGRVLERECALWANRWSIGGHPWLKAKVEEAAVHEMSERNLVTVFSAPIADTRRRLSDLIPQLRNALPSALHIVIKPHPSETDAPAYYAPVVGTGTAVASRLEDSYALLARSVASVCENSTVAIDAIAFQGVSTVLDSPVRAQEIQTLIDQGAIQLVRCGADIAELIHDQSDKPPRALANAFFGLDAPPLDFANLINDIRHSLRTSSRV